MMKVSRGDGEGEEEEEEEEEEEKTIRIVIHCITMKDKENRKLVIKLYYK